MTPYGENVELFDIAFDWDVRSPFEQLKAYDGNVRGRPQVDPDQRGGLLWHELVRA